MRDAGTLSSRLASHPGWDVFLSEHWLRKPFLFKDVLAEPFLSEGSLLETYRVAGKHAREDANVIVYACTGSANQGPCTWATLRGERAAALLPSQDDSEMASYGARLHDSRGIRAFSAHLRYNMLRFCPESWLRARSLLAPLFEVTGFPAGGWNLDCYAGQYKETSFGVHTDQEDQLYLTPLGTKVMKLWHPRDWCAVEDPDSYRYRNEQHPVSPLVYTVSPADILYWPQDYFHIGESPRFAVSVQINMRRVPVHALSGTGEDRTRFGNGYGSMRPSILASGGRLPGDGADTARNAAAQGEDAQARREEIQRYDLAMQSAWFTTVDDPPVPFHVAMPSRTLSEGCQFHVSREFPILYRSHSDEILIAACNAEVWSLPNTPVGQRLLECLSPGSAWSGKSLQVAINAGLPADEQIEGAELWEFLTELASAGVLLTRGEGDREPGAGAALA